MAQSKFSALPLADGTGMIRIDPQPEEQQAFEYLMRHLPAHLQRTGLDLLMKAYVVASYAHRKQKRDRAANRTSCIRLP